MVNIKVQTYEIIEFILKENLSKLSISKDLLKDLVNKIYVKGKDVKK